MKKIYKYLLSLIVLTSLLTAVNISTTESMYTQAESVKVNIEGTLSGNKDWVGLYRAGASSDWKNVVAWSWVNGNKNNLSMNSIRDKTSNDLLQSEGGHYEVRLFFNNSYKVEASEKFYVKQTYPALFVTYPEINIGDKQTVLVNTPLSGDKDWVGIYPKGSDNSWDNVIAWNWATYGDVSLNKIKKEMPAGEYDIRLFFHNSFDEEKSTNFYVIAETNTLNTTKATYSENETVSVNVNATLSGNKDWVGIYKVDDNNDWANVIAWNWVNNNDIVALDKVQKNMPAGNYEARLFFNNSYKDEAKSVFSIKAIAITVSNIHPMNITKNSAKIFWDVSSYATGQVEYGETTAYGILNTKETSFDYNHHEQTLKNLKAGTTYHYRVISEDANGQKVVSDDYTFTTLGNDPYQYGKMGDYNVEVSTYSEDNLAVVYHPTNWDNTPTPVIFFAPGWHNKTHTSYQTLLRFIASHGYSVIYMPDTGSYPSQADKFDSIVNEFSNQLDTSKVGILGHSAGGGAVFYLLEHAIDKGYGTQGRFMMSLDGYFAYDMDKANMQNLTDTNILFMQFGPSGNSTDPRVVLTNYNLLTGDGIDKNYIVLANDDDHGYPSRQDINSMQGMLKPLDALMEYTFQTQSNTHHALSLEGEGKINPYTNGYQQVLPIADYKYSCEYANGYHKGPNGASSDIDNCGVPKILPNNENNVKLYPPEITLTKKIVNSVDRPLEKFSSYIDGSFDNTVKRIVTRVTNREQDNKKFNGHQYPKQGSAWNSDMSLLRLVGRIYDAETLREIPLTKTKTGGEVYSLMKAPQSGSSGIRWSKHNPNILYVMSAEKKFYKLTISPDKTTMTEEIIIDLSASARPYFNIGQNEGNIDYEDKYVVLSSLDGNDTYAALLDIKAKKLVWGPKKLDFSSDDFDWISISPSGNYILISTNNSIRLYNRNLDFIRVLANRAGHGDIGYDQNGNEMYLQLRSGGAGVFGFVLNNNPNYENPIKLLDSNYGGGHISCRNYKRKGWCYVGTNEDGYREIYALKLDGSKLVQRFAKTNARGPEDPKLGDATHDYYSTHPTAIPSPDGTRILFWSDYGNPEGFLYYYEGDDGKWHTTDHYYNRDTYQVRIKNK